MLSLEEVGWLAAKFMGGYLSLFVAMALFGSGADENLSSSFPWQFRLAAACRTPVLVLLVVPLSFVQRQIGNLRRWARLIMRGTGGERAVRRHDANVESIASQIRAWNEAGRPRRLRTPR